MEMTFCGADGTAVRERGVVLQNILEEVLVGALNKKTGEDPCQYLS